jgi:hypothetical protein
MLTAQTSEQTINDNLKDARVKVFYGAKGTPSLIKMNSAGTTLSLSETQHFFNLYWD